MNQNQWNFIQNQLINVAQQSGIDKFTIEIRTNTEKTNFTTDLIPITINGFDNNGQEIRLNLMGKTLPTNQMAIEIFDLYNVFEREVYMYTKVFPEFEKLQNGKSIKYIPHVYYAISDRLNDQYLILMENETLNDYTLSPILESMNLEHFNVTLDALAHFHAFSYALRDQNPDLLNEIENNTKDQFVDRMEDDSSPTYLFANSSFKYAVNQLEIIEKGNLKIIEKAKMLVKRHAELMRECVKDENSDRFRVLNHGDLHIRNLLFRYGLNGIPGGIKLVDWQLSRFVSPALDLIFLIFVQSTKSFRDQYYNHLIKFYYQRLIGHISKLGSNPEQLISLDEIHRQIQNNGQFGVLFACSIALWNYTDSTTFSETFDELLESLKKGTNPFNDLNQLGSEKMNQELVDLIKDGFKYNILK